MQSPIQLNGRKFLEIKLQAHAIEGNSDNFDLSHRIAVVRDEEEPTHWRTKFGIRIENKPDQQSARYTGEITVVGQFSLAKEFPEEKAEQMVSLNSGAILYGAIRELVLNLTSQSIHGELLLPAIDARSFLPVKEDQAREQDQSS